MSLSTDDLTFLVMLQAEYPDHAAILHHFAEQRGSVLPPPTHSVTPERRSDSATQDPDASPALATDHAIGSLLRRRHEDLDPEQRPSHHSFLSSLSPSAATCHTNASRQGTELMAAVIARRRALGLTQAEFAARLGVSLRTYQEWEQGRRQPSRPAETMLRRQL